MREGAFHVGFNKETKATSMENTCW